MINRRNIFKAIAALPLLSVPAVAATQTNSLMVCTNKIGLPCTFSKEIAQDMMRVHRINIVDLFSRKYGTTFNITKSVSYKDGKQFLRFLLRTNDKRDGNQVWEISENRFIRGNYDQIRRRQE